MDSHSTEHGGHGGEVHLPDPSVWPLVVGVAALLVGIALVWWSNDRSNDFAGPVVGAAVVLALVSVAGWAWEDSRMRRKAEAGTLEKRRDARYTQVMTFAVADGALERARGDEGVIRAIDHSDLRSLNGFQDLRIIVSPAAAGPSQVLVETTWSGREGLAGYEGTRQTLLDVVNRHAQDVVPGSVQVFDMEVVRDTKESTFGFGLGSAAALLGSLAIAGFMLGAGLNIFKGESTAAAAPGGAVAPGAADPFAVVGKDNSFSTTKLAAAPSTDVTFTFKNEGKAKHNLHFLKAKGGDTLADGAEGKIIDGGQTDTLKFKTPGAGTYYYQCDVHPDQMNGSFDVKEGGPVPGAAGGAAAAGGSGANAVVATDNKYDKTTLTGEAGKELTVSFTNKGKAKHNVHFFDKKDGKTLADGAEGKIIDGGQTETLKFTVAAAGSYYYQCDLHPAEMTGKLTIS